MYENAFEKCTESSCFDRKNTSSKYVKTMPPDRGEIGRAGWKLLHSVAANYPEEPSEEDKKRTNSFYISFANVFPCHICREGIVNILENTRPPQLKNREELVMWMCEVHNDINEEVGHRKIKCNYKTLLETYQ
eukprot:GHVL01028150.1.p1 GENE.GHVL01028150.1~~GHVL01028150.1.p1  ORF type:complete len:146 (-),score=29.31 GHVL01028150.1:75-473(-)